MCIASGIETTSRRKKERMQKKNTRRNNKRKQTSGSKDERNRSLKFTELKRLLYSNILVDRTLNASKKCGRIQKPFTADYL